MKGDGSMKTLIKNGDYILFYDPLKVNRYMVYKEVPMGMSKDLKMQHMVGQSSIFTKKLKSYFTKQQVGTAIAKVHVMKYLKRGGCYGN